jgi:hypothetical protein
MRLVRYFDPSGGGKERNVSNATKTIKWRAATPIVKAGATFGTVVALITVVGAPFKWMMIIISELL